MPRSLIYETFMRGQLGHGNLTGEDFLEDVETSSRYRLWEVDGRWPALIKDDAGVAIAADTDSARSFLGQYVTLP
jgi:hypothetical protein